MLVVLQKFLLTHLCYDFEQQTHLVLFVSLGNECIFLSTPTWKNFSHWRPQKEEGLAKFIEH
jgi:hypothetical protein